MICTGSSNCSQNRAAKCRMPDDHRVHRIAQPVLIEPTAHGDIQLHRIHIVAIPARCWRETAAPAATGSAAKHQRSGIAAAARRSAAGSAGQGRYRTGVNPPPPPRTCAQIPARASNHNRLSRLTCARSSGRGRPPPVGVQLRAGVGVHGAGVELHGVRQRHGHRRAGVGKRQAVLADPPHITGHLGRRARRDARDS